MSETEELKAFKQKLELKYGRLAKKRLAKLSKVAKLLFTFSTSKKVNCLGYFTTRSSTKRVKGKM